MEPTLCKTYLSAERILVTDEFISRNKLTIRPAAEIIKQMNIEDDYFDFSKNVYLYFLPYDLVRELLTDDAKLKYDTPPGLWKKMELNEAVQDFLDYMNFAWGKAEDERGISASRSIHKLGAWLYAFGREDLFDLIHKDHLYNPYGAPALIAVCNEMGIPVPESLIAFAKNKCF